jgi:hypothetical protein
VTLGPVEATFLKWLASGLSGCRFAQRDYSKERRILLPLVGPELEFDSLEVALDGFSKRGMPVVALFPWACSEGDVVGIISALSRRDRWTCEIVSGLPIPRGRIPIRIAYSTDGGYVSEAMGFGPLLAMPPTRRAPFVGLGAWAGGRENPFAPPKRGPADLSFLDMPTDLTEPEHRKLFDKSTTWTRARMSNPADDPPDDARSYRRIAFSLSEDSREALIEAGLQVTATRAPPAAEPG